MKWHMLFAILLVVAGSAFGDPRSAAFADDAAKEGGSEKVAPAPQRGASSPQQAFEVFQRAVDQGDWEAAFSIQSDRSRDGLVTATLATCAMSGLDKEGEQLASEYADTAKLKDLLSKGAQASADDRPRIVADVAALVTKKTEFMSRAQSLFKQKKHEAWLTQIAMKELRSVKIVGERATGRMDDARVKNKRGGSSPIAFVRQDGRWYVDFQDE